MLTVKLFLCQHVGAIFVRATRLHTVLQRAPSNHGTARARTHTHTHKYTHTHTYTRMSSRARELATGTRPLSRDETEAAPSRSSLADGCCVVRRVHSDNHHPRTARSALDSERAPSTSSSSSRTSGCACASATMFMSASGHVTCLAERRRRRARRVEGQRDPMTSAPVCAHVGADGATISALAGCSARLCNRDDDIFI